MPPYMDALYGYFMDATIYGCFISILYGCHHIWMLYMDTLWMPPYMDTLYGYSMDATIMDTLWIPP